MRITDTPKRLQSFCGDALCESEGVQTEVDGIEIYTEMLYEDYTGGGDLNDKLPQNSWISHSFKGPDGKPCAPPPCEACGKPLAISDQVRVVYPARIFGPDGRPADQKFLLGLIREGKVSQPGESAPVNGNGHGDRMAAMEAELAELRGFVAGLKAAGVAPADVPGEAAYVAPPSEDEDAAIAARVAELAGESRSAGRRAAVK